MSNEFVTVASCLGVPEAHILMGRLRNEGIPAFLRNENLVSVQWLYSAAVGGVEIVVPLHYAQEAASLLSAESSAQQTELTTVDAPVDAPDAAPDVAPVDAPETDPACPHCGTLCVPFRYKGFFAALSLYLGIPFPGARMHWRCPACGKKQRGSPKCGQV